MLSVSIIALGTLKERYLKDAVTEYAKRMTGLCSFEIIELAEQRLPDAPSAAQIVAALEREGEQILKRVKGGTALVALCIEGEQYSSEQLAEYLQKTASGGCSSIAFVLGSSYGLSDSVKQRAALRLSMSRMTFPHQLARVMVSEQLYRALKINAGGRYHK